MNDTLTQTVDNRKFYKKLVKIALPIALQGLISSSLTLLDNLMVSSLGELSLTSVGLATQTFTIEWMLIFGFCSGCATFYTQFWGIRELKNIRKVIGLALCTCFAAGLIFFIAGFLFPVQVLSLFTNSSEVATLGAQYLRTASINFILVALTQPFTNALRSTQQTKIPMFIAIGSFLTDALFNYLLIFGKFGFPKLGVKGAAIATVLARTLELVLTYIIVFAKKNIIAGNIKDFFSFDKRFAKRVYANTVFTTLNEVLWSSAVVAQNAAYGHIGITAYAAVQATATIMDLFQMACFSIGDASLILIGERIGRNEMDEAKGIAKKLIKTCWVLGFAMTGLLLLIKAPIISLFSLTDLGVFFATRLIIIRAIVLPFNLQAGLLIAGIFRAGGDAKFAAIVEISLMWLVGVPLCFAGAMWIQLPVYWVMALVQIEMAVKMIIMYKRYFSGKWIKNMISGM